MTAHTNAPVIIKRKKIIAGGHHGGAWKVAYADFVTAMMAFFLLMWLLGSTSEDQRKGIADYFNPTIPINRMSGGGDGSFNGDNVFSENRLSQSGTGAAATYHSDNDQARGDSGIDADNAGESEGDPTAEQLQEIADILTGRSGESMVSEEMARHIITRITDEGLIVELFDLPEATLFEGDSPVPTPLLGDLVKLVAGVFALSENRLAVAGHVRSQPVVRLDSGVWSASSNRAHIVRTLLKDKGFADKRIQRVTGFADRAPVIRNTMAVRNNRIELTLLR